MQDGVTTTPSATSGVYTLLHLRAANEYPERAQHALLVWAQQVIAPAIAAHNVRWREGTLHGASVNTPKPCRSLRFVSNAAGENCRMRAAASSIASGKQSRWRQISVTICAMPMLILNPGFTARAR